MNEYVVKQIGLRYSKKKATDLYATALEEVEYKAILGYCKRVRKPVSTKSRKCYYIFISRTAKNSL